MGGAEKLLVTKLKTIDREKFEPIVYCTTELGPLLEEVKPLNIPVHLLGTLRFYNLKAINTLVKFIKNEKIDIIHSHQFIPDILARIAGKLTKIPVVTTYHNVYPWKKSKRLFDKLKVLVDRITANHLTSQVVAVSSAVRNFHIKNVGIKEEKIKVMNNFIDMDKFFLLNSYDREAKKQELSLSNESKVIINIASLTPQKDHKCYFEAARLILTKYPNTMFLIAGDGELREKLQNTLEESGLNNNVKLLGNRNDVAELLKISDVFVLSSLWEGMPVTIIEAMAMGKPIVCTDVGGVRDAIIENENGYLVPPKDPQVLGEAILKLLDNEKVAINMGNKGKQIAEREFSADFVVRQFEEMYESFVKPHY